jgi:signal transduction histidine kinase/ligand-binding sensor domain-containing protein
VFPVYAIGVLGFTPTVKLRMRMAAIALGVLLGGCTCSFALNPSLDINQYGHTAWTIRDGFATGTAFAMAQTPDGYLWLASEFGLFRSDGVRFVRWQPPAGQQLPESPYALLVTRDGTLWIGTYGGLASWNNGKLTQYPKVGAGFITSLLEDREGTVWAGDMGGSPGTANGQLCAIQNGSAQCYGQDGAFGGFVWSLGEDSSGALWAGAESGLWRWKPGPPKHYAVAGARLADLTQSDDGRLIVGIRGGGLRQVVGDKLEAYPIRSAMNSNGTLPDRDIDANKLLRDRDGGLWIGTNQRGLIHVHHGRSDVFTAESGLSGNIIAGLFEDREGNIWVSTAGGLDRFRELPVTTVSTKQGLSSDNVQSVIATTDGSTWIATRDGLTRWQKGQTTVFRKADGLPDDMVQSMYQDHAGRIWVFTGHGLAWFNKGRFVSVDGVPSTEVYSITGDNAGNLWLSGNNGLSHLREGRLIENLPWTALGRRQQAKAIIFDQDRGGLWLGFWQDGVVEYFKDGQVRLSYTAANGMTKGPVAALRLDRDGAVWAATQNGGVSRIKDGRITTLTTSNGLPCDRIHWTTEEDDRSLWLYTACGLVRIPRSQVDAWISDPRHRVEPTVWDATDGALPWGSPSSFGPTLAKAADGKLWYVTREDIEVVDPPHLASNKLAPPIHVEKVVADHKMYWQNIAGSAASNVRLPALTRDLEIGYTALSLTAPEKVHFKYKLEGQDSDWREVVNDREAQYSNLTPGPYRFRVIACNNSGVWNEQGDSLEFSIAPAYYQTNWFRALCAVLVLALVWAIYQIRVRQLHHEFALTLGARLGERTSIARELHDTLLQSFHGLLLRFQIVSELLPDRPVEAKEQLDKAIDRAAEAITEGRDAVQGLRTSTVETNDLARAINTLGEELAPDPVNDGSPAFRVTVEGDSRDLHPILRDEIYRIAAEALRNAFRHAQARHIEADIRYDKQQFRLRVRDDGKGMDTVVLSGEGPEGHFGLRGMRERAKVIGGKLVVWSELGAGTELELIVPASSAYTTAARGSWLSQKFAGKA